MSGPLKNYDGQRIGRWVILSRLPYKRGRTRLFTARCDCGREQVVSMESLGERCRECYLRESVEQRRRWNFCGRFAAAKG